MFGALVLFLFAAITIVLSIGFVCLVEEDEDPNVSCYEKKITAYILEEIRKLETDRRYEEGDWLLDINEKGRARLHINVHATTVPFRLITIRVDDQIVNLTSTSRDKIYDAIDAKVSANRDKFFREVEERRVQVLKEIAAKIDKKS